MSDVTFEYVRLPNQTARCLATIDVRREQNEKKKKKKHEAAIASLLRFISFSIDNLLFLLVGLLECVVLIVGQASVSCIL